MNNKDVKTVLNSPCKPLLLLALELVNLKDKERQAIEYVDIKGCTIECVAEQLNIHVETVKNRRKSAYKKMCKAWENQEIIQKILEG